MVEASQRDLGRGRGRIARAGAWLREGLYEKARLRQDRPQGEFLPKAVSNCGIGIFVWSTAIAYADKLKTGPTSWADFWDVKKFPASAACARAKFTSSSRCWPTAWRPPTSKVLGTKAGVERAFKLDQIKGDIQWWEAGAQPPQLLASAMWSRARYLTAALPQPEGRQKNLQAGLERQHLRRRFWAIPKGTTKRDEAYSSSSSPASRRTSGCSRARSPGPTHMKGIAGMDPKIAADLPTAPENLRRVPSPAAPSSGSRTVRISSSASMPGLRADRL